MLNASSSKLGNSAIVMCLDDRFTLPVCTTIESIGRHGGSLQGVTLVMITTGLSDLSVVALEMAASKAQLPLSIRTINDADAFASVPDWAVSTCIRLFVGEVCNDFERVLYVDGDMLVLSELREIIDLDLGEKTAAAVINHPPLNVMRVAIPRSRRGSASPDAPYFNAGLFLIDVERWHSRSIGKKSRQFIKEFPTSRLFDQDALNIALVDDWLQLDMAWNAPAGSLDDAPMMKGLAQMNPRLEEELKAWVKVQEKPKILHFTGQPKPWEDHYPWRSLKDLYHQYIVADYDLDWPTPREQIVVDVNGNVNSRGFMRQ